MSKYLYAATQDVNECLPLQTLGEVFTGEGVPVTLQSFFAVIILGDFDLASGLVTV